MTEIQEIREIAIQTFGCEYDYVNVEITHKTPFSIRWTRCGKRRIFFNLAEDIKFMPSPLIRELFEKLSVQFIKGEMPEYSEDLKTWLDENRWRWTE